MKNCSILIGLLSVVAFSCAGCNSPYHRDQGALLGGLGGAAIGAAIGEHNDNPLAGAAIGAAVGTLGGAAIGSNMDAQVAQNNAIIEQRMGHRLSGAVTIPQIISMSQAKLSDEVIVTHIRANGIAGRPTTDDLITLNRNGVSDRVINALQSQPPITAAIPTSGRRPVIVEEHYYARPRYIYSHPHSYYHHRHCGPGWGFSFSN